MCSLVIIKWILIELICDKCILVLFFIVFILIMWFLLIMFLVIIDIYVMIGMVNFFLLLVK